MKMKKIASLFLATAMTLSMVTVPAYAEAETEATLMELDWDETLPETLGVDGDFYTFDEIAVQMFVPAVMQPVELTEEDVEQGFIGYFATDDESAVASVVYVGADGETVEEYAEELAAMDDVEDVEMGILNGIECVTYSLPEQDSNSVAFATEAGNLLEFTFAPMSDEGYKSVASLMTLSIQPYEEAETEA